MASALLAQWLKRKIQLTLKMHTMIHDSTVKSIKKPATTRMLCFRCQLVITRAMSLVLLKLLIKPMVSKKNTKKRKEKYIQYCLFVCILISTILFAFNIFYLGQKTKSTAKYQMVNTIKAWIILNGQFFSSNFPMF